MLSALAINEAENTEMSRIQDRFSRLQSEQTSAFIPYIMAGDPDYDTTLEILRGLPGVGVDVIELGFPFTDPMADGPTIQLAGQRALGSGMTLARTLNMVSEFRESDSETPLVLMGYFNPVLSYGIDAFLEDAVNSGVDGLIIVDLPPEEDDELCVPALDHGVDFIRLATPTTDAARLPKVRQNTSGFIYYVSITGITGAGAADADLIAPEVARIRDACQLPVCVGFGIRTPEAAADVARVADGAVVGTAIVQRIAAGAEPDAVLGFIDELALGVHNARKA